ncbi:MAG TPA: PQQ-dependent dehydrogenase, methanol/ethanol family, partial [Rhodomicrobium sp.]|nr:PQQ-dependent dehydrogenase, methanol/ethanol family [Rhodomicrobium sp.]
MKERMKSVTAALLTAGAVALAPAAGLCADNGWPVYGQNYANTRFSPLKQINSKNVNKLKLAYSFSLASLRSNESTPLVIGDTMYVTSSWGPKFVYALNAATGEQKWVYEPEIPDDVMQYGCCDVQNRGAAYA